MLRKNDNLLGEQGYENESIDVVDRFVCVGYMLAINVIIAPTTVLALGISPARMTQTMEWGTSDVSKACIWEILKRDTNLLAV